MKVERSKSAQAQTRSRGRDEGFRRLLEQIGKKPQPASLKGVPPSGTATGLKAIAATTRTAVSLPERLTLARGAFQKESERLEHVALTTREDRREAESERLGALERKSERESPAPHAWHTPPRERVESAAVKQESAKVEGAVELSARTPPPVLRGEVATSQVATAIELVERIEAFVKSNRPALALTLRGTLEGRVEIQRVGPNEVSVTLQARSKEVPLSQMARVRDELLARGLKVKQLRVS